MEKVFVTLRQRCDLELLLVGGFNPLSGFLTQADYDSVLHHLRLTNGVLWPMPITLDVNDAVAEKIALKTEIMLCDADGSPLAYMTITDKWQPNKSVEAQAVFGTEDHNHPGVSYLFHNTGKWYLGGTVRVINTPSHYDFIELRHTPTELKAQFSNLGNVPVIGFQTRNPMHRAHMELTLKAAQPINGHLLIHPVVGLTKPGDIDHYTRVRCYQKIMPYYPSGKATLSLLPLAMRMAGPREALWHALIRKNYGCTHFIVGRDHAGPGSDTNGNPFYAPFAAQDLVQDYKSELGICILPFQEMVYIKDSKQYCVTSEVQTHETALTISGTELRHALFNNKDIPEWFSFPDVIQELRLAYPPKHEQGFTLFFTGLSGAGKSTLAQALIAKLMSVSRKRITLLDGDIVRKQLASELGFTKPDRDLNILRIGFVASEVTKAGGIVLCAAIAPYENVRRQNRALISQSGGYIEVYVSTPLSTCEKRDTKGLYAKARSGKLKGFTGVNDPYEAPIEPEITIDTSHLTIQEALRTIITFLKNSGYLKSSEPKPSITKKVNNDERLTFA
ncbi:MAG: bifunctional sulfate adenylyltransferase/adenylylsulfate kinase [Gammaproteobacteria bacterium]|nr:bifunctional sulfate adenylyltransferase/adenylylsulfate kinase [Gammaproteobacteria bacterium]